MSKMCPKCGTTLAIAGQAFCYKDGTRLIERPTCTCGNELHPADKYCPVCGKQVEKAMVASE